MIKITPSYLLLVLPVVCTTLGLWAIFLTGLNLEIQIGLTVVLLIVMMLQSLGLMQMMPKSLLAFMPPDAKHANWQIELKQNRKRYDAKLLGSSRVGNRIILLHFETMHPKIRVYQIILASMIGQDSFHQLLVYLKTH